MKRGLKRWYPSEPEESGICGTIEFETYKHAFEVLITVSSDGSVTFLHEWYSDWSWFLLERRDAAFFERMNEQLNDDCIREIIKYVDIPRRIHFASHNERFRDITLELSRNLHIFPSSVGTIGLMNFRYLLEQFGSSVMNLSVSLKSITSTHGFYYTFIKSHVLGIIFECTGFELKKIRLYDFDLNERYEENFGRILPQFAQRGVQVTICSN